MEEIGLIILFDTKSLCMISGYLYDRIFLRLCQYKTPLILNCYRIILYLMVKQTNENYRYEIDADFEM